jgi:hypothetical protein
MTIRARILQALNALATEPPQRARSEPAECEHEAALERVRAIPRLPHSSEQTGELGRAYTRGWESVISALDKALATPAVAAPAAANNPAALIQRTRPANAHRVTLLHPLPTRIRLAIHHQVDRAGYWLAGRGHGRAAEWLWRACRMW